MININKILNLIDKKVIFISFIAIVLFSVSINKFILEKHAEKVKVLDIEEKKREISEELIIFQNKTNELNKILFDVNDSNAGDILSYINGFLEKNKVKIISVSSVKVKKKYQLKQNSLTIKLEGSFKQILDLIKDFYDSEYLLRIDKLIINKKKITIDSIEKLNNPVLVVLIDLMLFSK
jgi:hypothetical protein